MDTFTSDRIYVETFQNLPDGDPRKMKAAHELFGKYRKLRYRMYNSLRNFCFTHNIKLPAETYEEYDGLAWEKFILNVLPGVKLDRVTHHENWTICIRFQGYLMAMNRDIVNNFCNKWRKGFREIRDSSVSDGKTFYPAGTDKKMSIIDFTMFHDGRYPYDGGVEKEMCNEIFWESMTALDNTLKPDEVRLLNMKYQGYTVREIETETGLAISFQNRELKRILKNLEEIFREMAKSKGIEMELSDNFPLRRKGKKAA